MEKKNFVLLLMTVVGGILFSLGMCMCLLPEWAMLYQGIGLGAAGAAELLVTLFVYRRLSGRKPVRINVRLVGKVLYGVFSVIVFGLGMCMVMVFEGMLLWGILVGIVGIVLLLCLLPMCVGLKDGKNEK